MSDTSYDRARRRILNTRSAAGLTGSFTFSYSCGATRLLTRLPPSWPAPPPRAAQGSEFRYMPEAWTADDGRPRFVGTPDQLVADFRLLAAAGVEHVTLRFGSTTVRDLETFSEQVRPAFAS
jgi:alkanesulfonate monooxygenase SsuD/methylene tetrahydromethanopterin reductase-like flavin-dependent oxidoreductase (luciferase family)